MSQSSDQLTILVVRSGGFAGIRRAWRVLAEGSDVERWAVLVEACPWEAAEAASTADDAAGADRFAWEVAAARAGADHRALLAEDDAGGPWRELIDRVRSDGESVAADTP